MTCLATMAPELVSTRTMPEVPANAAAFPLAHAELPVGALRIREKGSAGTHNGMRSIIACVNSENFPRIRIGVGDRNGGDLKDYVLGRPGKGEQVELENAFCDAVDAAKLILEGKLQQAQAKYNKRHIGGTKAED